MQPIVLFMGMLQVMPLSVLVASVLAGATFWVFSVVTLELAVAVSATAMLAKANEAARIGNVSIFVVIVLVGGGLCPPHFIQTKWPSLSLGRQPYFQII